MKLRRASEGKKEGERIEGPYAVPPGWRWTTLTQAGRVNPRNEVADDMEVGFAPMAAISDRYGMTPVYERRLWRDVKFQLVVDQGQIIPGRVNEDFMSGEDMRRLWGKRVSVKGVVHFKPSGHVRLLDAHMLKPMEEGEDVFGMAPQVQSEAAFVREVAPPQGQKDWLKDTWGQWPGDESIEELLADITK